MTATIDAPLLPGHRVLIRECTVVQWKDGGKERRAFKVWIDEGSHTGLIVGGRLKDGAIMCSDHDGECDCKRALRASHLLED